MYVVVNAVYIVAGVVHIQGLLFGTFWDFFSSDIFSQFLSVCECGVLE